MLKIQKYLVIGSLLCFYLWMLDKKNLYGLYCEFESEELARSYLTSQKFVRNPYVPSAWFNKHTGVDAHLAKVNELGGSVSFLVTYWARHVEAKRGLADLKPIKESKLTRKLELVGANYAQE